MAHKSDFDKFWTATIIMAVFLMMIHLYYFTHPLLSSAGLTVRLIDGLMLKLRAGGAFTTIYNTKLPILALLVMSVMPRTGKGTQTPWAIIAVLGFSGTILYMLPAFEPAAYLMTTASGVVLLIIFLALFGRKIFGLEIKPATIDRAESFEQARKKINTDVSINIPIRYKYKKRKRRGWINVVSPFRASLVLGTPGAGKSYSVYGPFIEQMIAKGFSLFVYDYKYPDLTQMVWNELKAHPRGYRIMPEFCVINYDDPAHSLRCNPIDPKYITDPADATEIADLVMMNINKNAIEKEDFFTLSAKVYLDALIWFMRIFEGGRYCTFPHVIELMSQDYKKVFAILSRYPELAPKIKPFANALEGNAQEQLQGQIASAQIPMGKFISKKLYWVMTGSDFSLDINDSEHPKILCMANNPDRQAIYSTTHALFTSRMFKSINKKGRLKCGVLLDELPTIFLKGLDNLIATARSNKVAIVLCAQDKSQLRRDYGEKESEVIFNTVGNILSGQVNGKTAEDMSRTFGKVYRKRESQTRGIESDSLNISYQLEDVLPVSTIETLSQGTFFGKVADGNGEKFDEKFFYGEIKRNDKRLAAEKKRWAPVPVMTDFGDEDIEALMQANFEQVQEDVRGIIEREYNLAVSSEVALEDIDPFE